MKISLGCDHGGYELKEEIKKYLEDNNYKIIDVGTNSKDSVDYPEFGEKAAQLIKEGKVDRGIVICTTGIGISISANKVKNVRCALCTDSYMAKMTRRHNDANMLAMGAGIIGKNLALEIVDTFLNVEFEGGRHQRRIDKISDIENEQ